MTASPSSRLPAVTSWPEFSAIRRDEAVLGPGVRALCTSLGLGLEGAPITRFADGSLPVYAVGEAHVLKLYPPFDSGHRESETAVLRALSGRLPVPTPAVIEAGSRDGWGFVLMERLHGESLVTAWPRIPAQARGRLMSELGRALAALHAVPAPELPSVRVDWPAFLAEQQRTAVDRQRKHGLPETWLEQIPAFLAETPLPPHPALHLLHTEVMREHLLVSAGPTGWALSGLFDFEPALQGALEYEFASVGLFVSCGEAHLLAAIIDGYHSAAGSTHVGGMGGDDWARRVMAHALLHRYSNLAWYLQRLPPAADSETTLEALARRWWGR